MTTYAVWQKNNGKWSKKSKDYKTLNGALKARAKKWPAYSKVFKQEST